MSSTDPTKVYIDHTGKVLNLDAIDGSLKIQPDSDSEISIKEKELLIDVFEKILKEQKLTNLYLSQIIGEELEVDL